jgi:uncharacterized protein YegL
MPIFDPITMSTHTLAASNFNFSATRISDLGATEYTLVTVAADTSSSVSGFSKEIERCIQEVVRACQTSPRSDNLMMRLVTFSSTLTEAHGFRPLSTCAVDGYRDAVRCGGMTALFDAASSCVESIGAYGKTLCDADFDVNAIAVVITDGMDNASSFDADHLRAEISRVRAAEHVESLVTILVGVNVQDPMLDAYLQQLARDAGFDQYLPLQDARAATLAKLAQFVSRSISAQSMALGSGVSQALQF